MFFDFPSLKNQIGNVQIKFRIKREMNGRCFFHKCTVQCAMRLIYAIVSNTPAENSSEKVKVKVESHDDMIK